MIKKIKNVDINYVVYGNEKKDAIVLLHGWGQNIDMMKPVGDYFIKNKKIVIVDLPGYGLSGVPEYAFEVSDYVECIKELLDSLEITNPILIGHSFGGKISLLYASKYNVKKLILFASPYKNEIDKLSIRVKILKFLKKVPVINKLEQFAKRHIGSSDYRNASPLMREILVLTVNLDITEDVKKITCPTIIFWGSNDEAVPLKRAYELESLIKDSGVVIFDKCTHYAYLERLNRTNQIIDSFIS